MNNIELRLIENRVGRLENGEESLSAKLDLIIVLACCNILVTIGTVFI